MTEYFGELHFKFFKWTPAISASYPDTSTAALAQGLYGLSCYSRQLNVRGENSILLKLFSPLKLAGLARQSVEASRLGCCACIRILGRNSWTALKQKVMVAVLVFGYEAEIARVHFFAFCHLFTFEPILQLLKTCIPYGFNFPGSISCQNLSYFFKAALENGWHWRLKFPPPPLFLSHRWAPGDIKFGILPDMRGLPPLHSDASSIRYHT